MNQSRIVLICVCLLLTMLGLLVFAGAIYDAEKKFTIDTFFFEPNSRSTQRIAPPISADDIPDKNLREWLIARFVHEYFYVIPYTQNANDRMIPVHKNGMVTPLYGMAPKVFDKWVRDIGPQIVDMAGNKVLRSVQILPDFTQDESGHLIVKYILQTWDKPNDMLALPTVQSGLLYMNITQKPIRVKKTEKVLEALKRGEDPASAFDFVVIDVEQH